jgi:ectoine hydroxylase-related dioxygenase (phytanoyl-CoA dioxygenase family)
VILDNALSDVEIKEIKSDLDKLNRKFGKEKKHTVHKMFFESSMATVRLIDTNITSDFAEFVISDIPGYDRSGTSLCAHVFHNSAYSIHPGSKGQASNYHTDDPLQNVVLPIGYKLPESVRLPVLAMTYMIWLSDCLEESNGPTKIIPGSHRFGRACSLKVIEDEKLVPVFAVGKAGTAVLINSQVWHSGSANTSLVARDTLQISWGRRIIGHKYGTIMDYKMPQSVIKNIKSEKLKQRLGYLPNGAYS